ncbi:MAG: hypothetical protein A2X13_00250 [Bacteroidetes bacterium GWC2_33_15]|nr:MAG: hypothetical protein A2X10_04060 [Bacteroidetes bacterium GWA2_33_15]OFX51056.1 MAG: hypothetical protein A2X13_00250 [Bacteroidetes bacterium GWC2_33_15]OFX70264.1 MAG: hypothetical protein A2X14_03140 [Bacteroidetes bacterium GWD2_33_33]HAN17261.1 hypothetical protein [Bacteroidales bacterium]
MKRTVTIVFLSFYILISLGLTINLHYCGGQFESFTIFGSSKSCCCGNEEMNKSCCENQILHYQINEEQQISQDFRIQPAPVSGLFFSAAFSDIEFSYKSKEYNTLQIEIPPPKKQPAWLINCSLTYYA